MPLRPILALLVLATALAALPASAAAPTRGSLIKGSGPAVYYYATDGKRYVFPNEKTYKTWYGDFSTVRTIGDAQLAAIAVGGNVTYRPGVRMVKVATDPKVYVVAAHGTLRPVTSESAAAAIYGPAWAGTVDDLPDAFFVNYGSGAAVNGASDFDPSGERAAAPTIAEDRDLAADWGGTDPANLPLGDGKHSSSPQKGYVYSCQTSFNGGGAFTDGPWIHGSTWDATAKARVDGNVAWPSASYGVALSGANRVITTNGLPNGHLTGKYPIASTDDAYQYDRNPNSVQAQSFSFTLPAVPSVAAAPSCVGGEVGVAVTGVPIFNGFDAGGRDAVAHELQDGCGGHPQASGVYHYHGMSGCAGTGDSELFGYAFDGFGIFSNLEDGKSLTNADLDECHGHAHEIAWDGGRRVLYHYHLTREFPYTIGCFKGTKYVTGPLGGGGMGGFLPTR